MNQSKVWASLRSGTPRAGKVLGLGQSYVWASLRSGPVLFHTVVYISQSKERSWTVLGQGVLGLGQA